MAPASSVDYSSSSSPEHDQYSNTMGTDHEVPVLRHQLQALVVDEDSSCRMINEGLLRSFGVQTEVVTNGRDALELVALGESYHVILIEKILPDIDGVEVTRLMRAIGVHCPMLAVTACEGERYRAEFLEAGVDYYIEKPVTRERLAEILVEIDEQLD